LNQFSIVSYLDLSVWEGHHGLLRDRTTLSVGAARGLFVSHIVSTGVAHCRGGNVGNGSVSSQKVNGTNREAASANSVRDFELLDDLKKLVEQRTDPALLLRRDLELLDDLKRHVEQKEKTGRLLRRNFELFDDLNRLVEQRTNTAPEKHLASPLRNSNSEETHVPRARATVLRTVPLAATHGRDRDENLPGPTPFNQERITAGGYAKPRLAQMRASLQSNVRQNFQPLPAGLHFLRQRREPTQVAKLERGHLRMWGYATLALISAGGVSFAAVQLLSSRPPNVTLEESRTTGIGGTIPTINQPVAIVLPRLRLSDVNEIEGKPVVLGIRIESARPDSFILIRGLPSGSFITKGSRIGKDGWRVPFQELAYAMLTPPPNFVGTMTLSVDLKNDDEVVTDSNVQRFTWSSAEKEQAPAQRADTNTNMRVASVELGEPVRSTGSARTTEITTAARSVNEPERPRGTGEPARLIPQSAIASLLSRANAALDIGDISAARLLLQRAAEAGVIKAAMSLASTYDPAVLRKLRTVGAQPNLDEARRWYEKAAELGSTEAIHRLKELR
jgi:hypothetical protein